MEISTVIESFVDYSDAFMFFEHHMVDYPKENYTLKEAQIVYLPESNRFRVGMSWEKEIPSG